MQHILCYIYVCVYMCVCDYVCWAITIFNMYILICGLLDIKILNNFIYIYYIIIIKIFYQMISIINI